MTRRLYRTPIPETAFRNTDETGRSNVAKLAAIQGGSSVQSVGTEPGELSLDVQYKGTYAGRLALELVELLHTDSVQPVPYAPTSGQSEDDGYYAAESVTAGRIRPQTDAVVNVDARLVREGTRASHLQAVETSKSNPKNDFGSDQVTHVGAPADASLVRWWDGGATVEYPTPVATRTAEYGDVDIYDVDAASFSDPTLVYAPAGYDGIGDVDAKVWDTYGGASKTDANGVVQWGRVFSPEHDYVGEAVIENGLLRLTLDEANQTIAAERWDTSLATPAWSSVSLGTSSWYPVDVDVRTIAPARIEARVLFSDGSSRYPLDMVLSRGDESALWVRTPNATSTTPSGLVTLLDPIAQTTTYDAGEEQGLAERTEVEQ